MTGGSPDPAGQIGDSFPGWRAWVSQTGRWWAMHDAVLSRGQTATGCLPLLWAEDGDQLAARIQEQEALRGLHPALRLTTLTADPDLRTDG
jgi:hypothetical protein